jgi:hypothetical protein
LSLTIKFKNKNYRKTKAKMKKILQKSMLVLMGLALSFGSTKAQTTTLTVDGAATWNGYMNVSDLGGAPQFGSAWGLAALKSTIDAGANTVTLQPNFNTYADAVASGAPGDLAYWTDGAGGGNKAMSALTFVESTALGGQAVDFTGDVTSNTLDAAYTGIAFIKVLDPSAGYATVLYQTVALPPTGTFTVSATIPSTPGLLVQYGFGVDGINANPADEVALGSIVVGAAALPPPAANVVTVDATATWLGYMNVYDLVGAPVFGSPWGVSALKSTIDIPSNTVTVQPNFNTYADAVASGAPGDLAFWTNGAGGGNKIMEANTYVESTTLGGAPLNFIGEVNVNTLSLDYSVAAFIKVLDPSAGYATIVNQAVLLPASGPFSVTATIPSTPGLLVQYGFVVVGVNANPADEAALGSIIIGSASPLSACTVDLNATYANDAVAMQWHTGGCKEVAKYTVEKSTDNVTFTPIANVTANQAEANYNYTDNSVFAGQAVYYRVVATLLNGATVNSAIARVVLPTSQIAILPTSATTSITVISEAKKAQLATIYNTTGTLVRTVNITTAAQNVDVSSLPTGVYYLSIANNASVRFVKQ